MPAFSGKSANVFARNSSVKFDHWFAAFDGRIRSAGNDDAGLNKTIPRVRAFQALYPQTRRREVQIANRVRSLHRRNDSKFREARNVSWIHDLGMFVAPTRLRNLSLRFRNGV